MGVFALAACLFAAAAASAAETVHSPDGRIRIDFRLRDQQPYWSIVYDGDYIVKDGLLGIRLDADGFGGLKVAGTRTDSADSTWKPVWGDLSEVRDHYNELTVMLHEIEGARVFHVILRAYNEGVACRYHFPGQPRLNDVIVRNSLTEFRFLDDHVIYQNRNYEYGNRTIRSMSRSEGNVTVALGDGRFVSLTDAHRDNYPETRWQGRRDGSHVIDSLLHSPARIAPPMSTSWEVMIVGRTVADLYLNRYLVENLNPPCAIEDTSWIVPGKAISQVRNARLVDDEMKALLDWASAHGIEYVEIDHSWYGSETKWTPGEIANFEKNKGPFWADKPEWRENVVGDPFTEAKGYVPFRPHSYQGGTLVDLDLRKLAAYGKSLDPPVGIGVYLRGALLKEFGGEHPADSVFAAYADMGLAGVKPGFVPPASQQCEKSIADMVASAARHRLQLNIHDAYYPSGLSRTYPNLVNIEGVAGDEAEHSIPMPTKCLHDVMLPFTRALMGPLDYTPEIGRQSKTHCHQVAMLAIYPGRVTIRGGTRQWAAGGEGGDELEFVVALPGLFDELKVFTELGKYVTFARRKGATWYVAAMSGPEAAIHELPLDFLDQGVQYHAAVYSDVPGQRRSRKSEKLVTSETTVSIVMEPCGGGLMILQEFLRGKRLAPGAARAPAGRRSPASSAG
jgi:alpha-glucosidase